MREKFKQQLEEMYRQMVIMGSLCPVSYTHLTLPTICSV